MAWGGCVGLAAALLVAAGEAGAVEAGAPGAYGISPGDSLPGAGRVADRSGATARVARAVLPGGRGDERRNLLSRTPDDGDDAAAVAEALGLVARIAGAPTGLSREAERALAAFIVREARAASLDPLLVAAVIEVESSFRPRAVSRAGALGLMQVMPDTGAWLAAEAGQPDRGTPLHLLEPEWNVALGVRYLAHLLERFEHLDEALVAYNAGPTRARRLLAGDGRSRWLAGYPQKVLAARDRFREEARSRGAGR